MPWYAIAPMVSGGLMLLTVIAAAIFFKYLNARVTVIRVLIVGTIGAIYTLMLPLCYYHQLDASIVEWRWPIAACYAIFRTFQVFLMDAQFPTMLSYLSEYPPSVWLSACRLCYIVLALTAPLLTAGFVLSLVNEIRVRVRLFFLKGKKVYVFSELNDCTLVLAKSIRRYLRNASGGKRREEEKAVFLFAVARSPQSRASYENVQAVKELRGAFCCRRDVVALDRAIRRSWTPMPESLEYFLLNDREAENINYAIGIAENPCKLSRLVPHIYAAANSSANSAILDSLNAFRVDKGLYDDTDENGETRHPDGPYAHISKAERLRNKECFERAVKSLPEEFCSPCPNLSYERMKEVARLSMDSLRLTEKLHVRRFQPTKRIARRALYEAALHKTPNRDNGDNLISIMIVGCGEHGVEFLKTAVWLYQLPGYRLEINVVDLDKSIQDAVKGQCPEIECGGEYVGDGGCPYSLKFYQGINPLHYSFEQAICSPEKVEGIDEPERLRRTTAIVVALGDDDLDIEVSMHLRRLFDRLTDDVPSAQKPAEEERVKILSMVYNESKARNVSGELRNFKKQPYNIQFVGDMNQLYNYEFVTEKEEERDSFLHHVRWVYNQCAYKENKGCSPLEMLIDYSHYEYFRISSKAALLHNKIFTRELFPTFFRETNGKRSLYEHNTKGREIEHRRWTAFLRSMGYVRGDRNDRAMRHNELAPFGALSPSKQEQDV